MFSICLFFHIVLKVILCSRPHQKSYPKFFPLAFLVAEFWLWRKLYHTLVRIDACFFSSFTETHKVSLLLHLRLLESIRITAMNLRAPVSKGGALQQMHLMVTEQGDGSQDISNNRCQYKFRLQSCLTTGYEMGELSLANVFALCLHSQLSPFLLLICIGYKVSWGFALSISN